MGNKLYIGINYREDKTRYSREKKKCSHLWPTMKKPGVPVPLPSKAAWELKDFTKSYEDDRQEQKNTLNGNHLYCHWYLRVVAMRKVTQCY